MRWVALAALVAIGLTAQLGVAHANEDRLRDMNRRGMEAYDLLEYEEARQILSDAIVFAKRNRLGDAQLTAEVHLNLGIVFFSGMLDENAAAIEFVNALEIDPSITIPAAYRTEAMQSLLDEIRGDLVGSSDTGGCSGLSGLDHTLIDEATRGQARTVTARVASDVRPRRVMLFYRDESTASYSEVEMREVGADLVEQRLHRLRSIRRGNRDLRVDLERVDELDRRGAFVLYAAEKYDAAKRFLGGLLGVFIAWMFAGGYIAYLRNVVFRIADVAEGRELWEIGIYAPRLIDFARRGSMDAEKLIYPGIVALAAAGFSFARKKGEVFSPGKKTALWFYGIILFLTAVLSLGPNLRGIPLYSFFYNYVPFFHYPRSTARIFVFTMLALSVLGAYGVDRLYGMVKSKAAAKLLAPVLILLALFDYQSFRSIGVSTLARENSAYEYVKKQDEPGFLLEVPLWPGDSSWSSIYLYYNTIYRLPMVNGYSPFVAREYIEGIFWPLVSVNMGVINSSQHERLRELGVNYIMLHEEAYPAMVSPFPFRLAVENMKGNPFVEFVKREGPIYLFRVRSEADDGHETVYSGPSKMGVFYEAEHLYAQTGHTGLDEHASGSFARFADSDEHGPGFVLFGPYQLFPPGEYRIIFRLKGEKAEPDEVFARIDVAGREGSRIFAEKTLLGEDVREGWYADYELMFSIEELEVLEFRVKWSGNGRIWADYVYLTFQGEEDPGYSYRASGMFNSRGDYAYGLLEKHPPHNIAWGGARRYEEGSYIASFRIKTPELVDDEIAVLRVLHTGTREPAGERRVSGRDFGGPMEFEDMDVPFSLEKSAVLSFEVFYTRQADVRLEEINIAPVDIEESAEFRPGGPELSELRPGILRFEYLNSGFAGEPLVAVEPYPPGRLTGGHSYVWAGFIDAAGGGHEAGVLDKGRSSIHIDGADVLNTTGKRRLEYSPVTVDLEEGLRRVQIKHVARDSDNLFRLYWRTPSMGSPVALPVDKGFFSYIPGDKPR